MELLTSLLKAVALLLLTLQCSVSVRGLPAHRDDTARSDGDGLEDSEEGSPRYFNFEDEEDNWIYSDADQVCMTVIPTHYMLPESLARSNMNHVSTV